MTNPIKTKIEAEITRINLVLKELLAVIDLIQSEKQEVIEGFVKQSKFLIEEYDLISEDCSGDELHQHLEYYEGYRNGLNFSLSLLITSNLGA